MANAKQPREVFHSMTIKILSTIVIDGQIAEADEVIRCGRIQANEALASGSATNEGITPEEQAAAKVIIATQTVRLHRAIGIEGEPVEAGETVIASVRELGTLTPDDYEVVADATASNEPDPPPPSGAGDDSGNEGDDATGGGDGSASGATGNGRSRARSRR